MLDMNACNFEGGEREIYIRKMTRPASKEHMLIHIHNTRNDQAGTKIKYIFCLSSKEVRKEVLINTV